MEAEPLHPDNKPRFADGDRVQFTIDGDVTRLFLGTVVGISTQHVIDHWIVLLDERMPAWPYRAITVQHTFLRREGSNEPFLCEGRGRFS